MATSAGSPGNLPLATALGRNESLGALLKRVRESRARFDTIAPLLPPPLAAAVQPGPLDESTWVLLAAHASAAAKLRQRLPELETALAAAGWPTLILKVKVSSAT
jgi:hypothetical protein